MTDTGQVPGEGQPESAGMVEQPGASAHGAYTYLAEAPAEDEDLLLPGAQGAWGNEVPPPAPEPVVETVHQPGAHEASGRDTGSVDLGGVRLPEAGPVSVTPSPILSVPHDPMAASQPPRRPLHLGPPIPDASASPVRSLADRGPAGAPVRQPGPLSAWGPQAVPAEAGAGAHAAETVGPDAGAPAAVPGAAQGAVNPLAPQVPGAQVPGDVTAAAPAQDGLLYGHDGVLPADGQDGAYAAAAAFPAQGVAQEPLPISPQDAAQMAPHELAQALAQYSAQAVPAQVAVQDPAQTAAQGPGEVAAEDPAQVAVETPAQDVAHDLAQAGIQVPAQADVQAPAQAGAEESAQAEGHDPAQGLAQEPAQAVAMDPALEAVEAAPLAAEAAAMAGSVEAGPAVHAEVAGAAEVSEGAVIAEAEPAGGTVPAAGDAAGADTAEPVAPVEAVQAVEAPAAEAQEALVAGAPAQGALVQEPQADAVPAQDPEAGEAGQAPEGAEHVAVVEQAEALQAVEPAAVPEAAAQSDEITLPGEPAQAADAVQAADAAQPQAVTAHAVPAEEPAVAGEAVVPGDAPEAVPAALAHPAPEAAPAAPEHPEPLTAEAAAAQVAPEAADPVSPEAPEAAGAVDLAAAQADPQADPHAIATEAAHAVQATAAEPVVDAEFVGAEPAVVPLTGEPEAEAFAVPAQEAVADPSAGDPSAGDAVAGEAAPATAEAPAVPGPAFLQEQALQHVADAEHVADAQHVADLPHAAGAPHDVLPASEPQPAPAQDPAAPDLVATPAPGLALPADGTLGGLPLQQAAATPAPPAGEAVTGTGTVAAVPAGVPDPLPSHVPAAPHPEQPLGQFVAVDGQVPTAPHLAPTPPYPLTLPVQEQDGAPQEPVAAVPAPREAEPVPDAGHDHGPDVVQHAEDLETRVAEQEESTDAMEEAGPAAPAYTEAERQAVLKVIRERRDIRNGFRSDPIPHDVLLRVLEAAHTAPSVGHSQPWDFVVIRSADTRQAMHELAMRQREAYAKSLPKGRAKQFKELKIEAILDTPVNIVVTADPTRGGRHTLGRHTQPQMAPYSAALAVENLWLAARAEGLGVGWVSFFDEREMVRALGLPEHMEVIAYLCVGYVDEFPDEPELMQAGWSKRRPLSWVVHEETYGRRALPGEEPHDLLAETVAQIRPLDAKALGEAWERQKRMTKPAGALGMLEIISAQLSGLSRQCPPPIPEPAAVAIFAGDHGVHAQGVTPWPQEVTAQMVANFLGGGAVCNAFAAQVGAEVCVVDVGVAADLPATPGLLPRKIRGGTSDMTTGPAMTREEAKAAIEVGIETARDLVAAGNKALLTGEMGIANTTASAALISVFTGADPAEVTGRGTGINDETLARKTEVVRRAIDFHQPDPADPVGVLAALGGFEHAAMVGLLLGGASLRTPVILDGVSAGAAALVARAIAPEVLAACVAGHRSAEPGHVAALNKLGLRPLVDLDLRLGEGTGALLALPLVQSAARAMHEVATFDSAGVTEK
ncbi:nicotinate-nucleotide--dimethylbenzimidazole phosphoribosyltransferase [Streptomyces sp. NPDC005573]|uniref:nicotinate-nucleotide--dimethylbenzimidazole phosphoribosyltransferase n=1 Tax=Streptomyces sp. NPDC005573 TaxID=3156890 RepID=UPI0033BCD657